MTKIDPSRGIGLCVALCFPLMTWAQNPPTSAPAAPAPAWRSQPAAGDAAVSGTLSLGQALALAHAQNPELAASRLEVEAMAGASQQAHSRPNPEIAYLLEDTQRQTRTTTLQLNQTIELGGKRAARMLAAERGHDIAAEELTARRLAIRASVTSAYYDALTAQERVRLAEQAMELAQRASRAAGQRVKAGKVAPIEETKAHVAQAGVQVELSQARSEGVGAQARLAALLGEPRGLSWRLDAQLDALPAVPSMADLERSLDNAPALRRARLEIDRRQALTELEKARRIPDITVSLGAKRSEELGRNQAIVGLSVPLPIFDTNRGNLLEALKREEKAREGLSASQLQVSAEARETRARLASLRQEAQLFAEQVLPGAQSAYDAAAKGFELGKFSFLEALDAQRTLLQARSQYLRTLADTHRARADLDRLLGLDESTETPLAPATVRRTGE